MSNSYVRAHGTTVKFGADDAIEDCTVVGIPGDQHDLIEKPSLTDTRIDYDLSDTPDSPEISVTAPYGATLPDAGDESLTIVIYLLKALKTATFTGHIIAVEPQPAEVGGLLSTEITIKPTSAVAIT